MAGVWERITNVFDDHQERDRQAEAKRVTEELRDHLLAQTLTIKQEWSRGLIQNPQPEQVEIIATDKWGRLDQINATFDAIRELNPSVSSRLDIRAIERTVELEANNHLPEEYRFRQQEGTTLALEASSGAVLRPERDRPTSGHRQADIVIEARELHSQFEALTGEYKQAPASQRDQIRQEMEPIVERERVLREEYKGVAPDSELSRDRVPARGAGFGY